MSKKSGKPGDNSSSSSSSKQTPNVHSIFQNYAASTKPKMSTKPSQQAKSPVKRKANVLLESDDDSDDERMKNKKLNNGTFKKFSSLSTKSASSLSSLSRKKVLSQQVPVVAANLLDTDISTGKSSSDSSSKNKKFETSNAGLAITKNKSHNDNDKSSSNKKVGTISTFNLAGKSTNGLKLLSSKSKKEQINNNDHNNNNNDININEKSKHTIMKTTTNNNGAGGHNDDQINNNSSNNSKRSSSVISTSHNIISDEEYAPPIKKKILESHPSKLPTTTTVKQFTPDPQNVNMNESLFEKSYILTPLASSRSTPCDLNHLNDSTKRKTPPLCQQEPWEDFHDFDSDLETPEKSKNNKKEQDSKHNSEMITQILSSIITSTTTTIPQHNKYIPKFQNNDEKIKEKNKEIILLGIETLKKDIGNIDNKPSLNTSLSLVNLPTPKSEPKPSSFPSSNTNQGKYSARKLLEFKENCSKNSSSSNTLSSTTTTTKTAPLLLNKDIPTKSTTTSKNYNSGVNNSSSIKNDNKGSSSSTSATLIPEPKDLLWVDKYKPTKLKSIIGQGGNNSYAQNLVQWLRNWFTYHGSSTDKARVRYPGLKDPLGKTFKVALLSGPPGVGKTTTAHLACKELGYTFSELNASDKRNKKNFVEHVQDKLGNFECISYFGQDTSSYINKNNNDSSSSSSSSNNRTMKRRHVLIMDEVDGMSGNEDRGGIQELIKLLKSSRIPIICICNDRNHPKIRSLANYCHDLRFDQPNVVQLKGLIQQICFKEKIKISPQAQVQLISSTNQDVRQIIHQLQMAKGTQTNENIEKVYNPQKDITLGPWEVAKKVFSAQDHQNMSINEKASLFFHDYNIGPLFVQENYLQCTPLAANRNRFKTMDIIKATAQSLAIGDITENIVRRTNNWGLLPVQAIFQSVLPGEYMETNSMSNRLDFPKWLGKNSNTTKRQRLLRELHSHAHLEISGSLEALNMDYVPHFKHNILQPLLKDDVDAAVSFMTDYTFLREDFDSIDELASFSGLTWKGLTWKGLKYENVPGTIKNSFTRSLNKKLFVPYSIDSAITKKRGKEINESERISDESLFDLDGESEERDEAGMIMNVDDESEDDNFEKDKMIKMKTSKGKKSSGKSSTTTKGGCTTRKAPKDI